MTAPHGFVAMSDRQLLGKLIGVREAGRLYQGSLHPLFREGAEPVSEKCAVARELVRRWLHEVAIDGCPMNSPNAVREYLRVHFARRDYEAFVAILVDAQHRVISVEELFRGTLTQTSVYPREVVKAALAKSAAAIIFAHNHPSGLAEPSQADRELTKALKHALSFIDVRVLDHLIVAGGSVVSFAERGLL